MRRTKREPDPQLNFILWKWSWQGHDGASISFSLKKNNFS